MATIGWFLGMALDLYLFLFFMRMVMSFVPLAKPDFTPRGALLVLFETVYTLTDPLIRFYDRFLPPLRLGGVALSLSFLAAWLTLVLAKRLVWIVF